jgi:hypothetical protein
MLWLALGEIQIRLHDFDSRLRHWSAERIVQYRDSHAGNSHSDADDQQDEQKSEQRLHARERTSGAQAGCGPWPAVAASGKCVIADALVVWPTMSDARNDPGDVHPKEEGDGDDAGDHGLDHHAARPGVDIREDHLDECSRYWRRSA